MALHVRLHSVSEDTGFRLGCQRQQIQQQGYPSFSVVVVVITITVACVSDTYIVVENCSANHPGCATIWYTDVVRKYRDLVEGTLSTDWMQQFCRF